MVLRDAMILDNWVDDRPPSMPIELLEKYNDVAGTLLKRYPNPVKAFTRNDVK